MQVDVYTENIIQNSQETGSKTNPGKECESSEEDLYADWSEDLEQLENTNKTPSEYKQFNKILEESKKMENNSKFGKGKRSKKVNKKYENNFLEINNINSEYDKNEKIPKSAKQALLGNNKDLWQKAIDIELNNMASK